MKNYKLLLIVLVSMVNAAEIMAQADSTTTPVRQKPAFKLGAYYNSELNYYGRTDSLHSAGFFPMAECWFNNKVYVTAAPVFVINKLQHFDYAGTVATLGIRIYKEKKYSTNIYLVKPFYEQTSALVQSALKAQLAGTFTWLNKIINVTAGADGKLSDRVDYGATAGLDHIFKYKLAEKTVLVLDPSAYVNAGTQQFTKTSYKRNNFLFLPGTQEQVTEQVNKFNILSYEFSMPVVLAKGKFQFIANPAYVLPQNLITVAGQPGLSEQGEDMFYITVGTKFNF